VQLNAIASWLLVIGYLIGGLIVASALVMMALALQKLNAKLDEVVSKIDPHLTKADEILTITNDKIASIGDKAEEILAQGEETAENVHHKVDQTATVVQRTIHAPIISLNSLAAGVSRGMETFGRLQRGATDGATTPATGVQGGEPHTKNGHSTAEQVPALAGKETMNGG